MGINLSNGRKYCAVVNSHESYHDVLSVFLRCFSRHAHDIELYVFSNSRLELLGDFDVQFLKYSLNNFRDQYLECLNRVPHDYVLTFNDDYFLTGVPLYEEIEKSVDVLESTDYSHVRFVRGPNFSPTPIYDRLYPLDNKRPYFFSQTLSLWKRAELIRVFESVGPSGIGRKSGEVQFEILANHACRQLGMTGLVYYDGAKKAGSSHYACNVMPHVVSAVVDGFWNRREYSRELKDIELQFQFKLNPARYRSSFNELIGRLIS